MPPDPTHPGPVYDRVMRHLVEADIEKFCQLVGVTVEGAPAPAAGSFPAQTLTTDLLAWVGPTHLLHAEYIRRPEPDTALKILAYRAAIMRRFPDARLTQLAIVLGQGFLQSADDPHGDFRLGLRTLYLRDMDPAPFLADAGFAPLAVLARGSDAQRRDWLAGALALALRQPPERRSELIEATMILAPITLDRSTIEQVWKEMDVDITISEVVDFYRDGTYGQELLKEGRQEGRQEARLSMVSALLRAKFGDRPEVPKLAIRLAASEHSDEMIVLAVGSAVDLTAVEPALTQQSR
jgi:hypothetical protein